MDSNPFFGVLLHAIGGLAAGSFYLPLKRIQRWAWESGWLVNGFFSWIIAPTIIALLSVPVVFSVILDAPVSSLMWTFLFGALWGIGGLTFGLSVRYLGMSLCYGVALGFCAAFGTLVPAFYDGSIVRLVTTLPGLVVLAGILVSLIGIGVCAYAGKLKEAILSDEEEEKEDFHLGRGLLVACFAGLMSACMAFAFAAGRPIALSAEAAGAAPIWVNSAVLVVILLGGFLANFLWCGYLLASKGTWKDYSDKRAPLSKNYIIVSNIWSLVLKEWKGTGSKTIGTLALGVFIITSSTVLIGLGNYFQGSAAAHSCYSQRI